MGAHVGADAIRRVMTVATLLMVGVVVAMNGQTGSPVPPTTPREAVVKTHATGPFDVKLAPQTIADSTVAATIGRMSIDKRYHGDLEATGKGEMLTAGTGVPNSSGGYVAIERVSGTLHGRKGTFVLQHSGTMTRGAPQLSVTVVPDSGTDELVGLTGTMMINIGGGKHSYDFEYTLPPAP